MSKMWKERPIFLSLQVVVPPPCLCGRETRIWGFVVASWHFAGHKVTVHGSVGIWQGHRNPTVVNSRKGEFRIDVVAKVNTVCRHFVSTTIEQ